MELNELLPHQLRNSDYRFALVKNMTKNPYEKAWQKNGYTFDEPKFVNHLQTERNYGIIGGFGSLLFLDFDDMTVYEDVKASLPETFTVRTGSGKVHLYYTCDKTNSFKILSKDGEKTLVDVQGTGKVVIGAGSLHPCGSFYSVLTDIPITKITYAELQAVFYKYMKHEERQTDYNGNNKELPNKIKSKYSIENYLSSAGINTTKNPTDCPFHSSQRGKCFSYNNELWHCFHCDRGGDIFTLVMEHKSIDFKEALKFLCKEAGLEDDYERLIAQSFVFKKGDYSSLKMQIVAIESQKELTATTQKNMISELLVQAIKEERRLYTTRDDDYAEVWIYEDGIYIPNGKTFVKEFCRHIIEDRYSVGFVETVIAKIEADTYIDLKKFFDNNNLVGELAVQNGILDVFTKELKPFTPDKVFFNKLPVTYEPTALKCEAVLTHLKNVLKNQSDLPLIQELFGYLLLKDYRFEKAFMFVGSGRNGKSKTMELMKRFLGIENCVNIPLQQLEDDMFSMSELFGKMANLCGDLSQKALSNTGYFKALTGRDMLSAQRKYKTRISFVNYAKMIFSTNELPRTHDISPAFWKRWIILEFPYMFVEKELFDSAPDKTGLKVGDSDIVAKICSPSEMMGLLNWALEGLDRLLKNDSFSFAKSVEEVHNLWLTKSDSFSAFCNERIESGDIYCQIRTMDLKREYAKYCEKNKIRLRDDRHIKNVLTTNYNAEDTKVWVKDDFGVDKNIRVYIGIRWKG